MGLHRKLDVTMVVAGMQFDGDTLKKQALGGSETAAIYMAQALARQGCGVTVFCNTPGNAMLDEFGARYIPFGAYSRYVNSTPHDVVIAQRSPELLAHTPQSRLNILWCHDLAMGRLSSVFNATMWNVDHVLVLSEYMRQQYIDVHGVDPSALYVTRNGLDLTLLDATKAREAVRDPFHLIYAARPERGLDILAGRIMPELLKRDPRFHLTVCGYGNAVPEWMEFYGKCERMLNALGPNNKNIGMLTKEQLYDLYRSAGCYTYPTPSPALSNFNEVSCISAMEVQACGLPIVTSARGALPETIAMGAGVLVEGDPNSDEYVNRFCAAVQAIAESESTRANMRESGLRNAQNLDWDSVAADWVGLFINTIEKNNDDLPRLVRHAWRNSDIVLAKEIVTDMYVKDLHADQRDELSEMLAPFNFAFGTDEDYAAQYAKIAQTHNADVFEQGKEEPRFVVMVRWLKEQIKQNHIETVLDYGCGLGSYAGFGSQQTGLKFTGVDIDAGTLDIARDKCAKHEIGGAEFFVGKHDAWPQELEGRQWDVGVLQEVLEHVREPWEVAEAVEKHVRIGGRVYITVPMGPWEYSSYYTYPYRCHIWHFDAHDLRDMFGDKEDLNLDTLYAGRSEEMQSCCGWWVVSYIADHKPVGEIDMVRKRWLQRPRQTVSASLMLGGDKACESLHWCLRSLKHISDEIIIADCGMDEETKHIVSQYPARVIQGVDPRSDGFEMARNIGLDACRMDWVLWIDADERLMNQVFMHKYLRENPFSGYSVSQVHFSVDANLTADTPVRLFRRKPNKDGKVMRFYGALHEHPEFGLNNGPGKVLGMVDTKIAHIGYLTEDIRKRRFERNYPLSLLDEARYPDRLLQQFFKMRDKVQMVRFDLETRTGGMLNDAHRAMLQEVVELGRKHFIGKGLYLNTDALVYYSDALKMLGVGFDVDWSLAADKVDAKPNGNFKYRFLNKEDFFKEFMERADRAIDPFMQEYY